MSGVVPGTDNPRGLDLIAAERQRQVDGEGHTPGHDLTHRRGQLAWAAACYAAPKPVFERFDQADGGVLFAEPWPSEWVANKSRGEPGYVPWRRPDADRIRELTKAGALIAAEIDRLLAEGIEA